MAPRVTAQLLLLALSACGGQVGGHHDLPDGGGDAGEAGEAGTLLCGAFSPCGGDIVGSWTVVGPCYDAVVEDAGCESNIFRSATEEGTIVFAADGTFMNAETFSIDYSSLVTQSCTTLSCDDIQASAQATTTQTGSGTVTCSSANGTCRCDIVASSSDDSSGVYAASAGMLVLTFSGDAGATSSLGYCVRDGMLTLHDPIARSGVTFAPK